MCGGDAFPSFAGTVRVLSNREIAPDVFSLAVARHQDASGAAPAALPAPRPGQFYMLRSRPSAVLLGRPISVYRSDADSITFLVLKKGKGTAELCALREGAALDLVGPTGNSFAPPGEFATEGLPSPKAAIIGGGIGVAPVAGFALGLPARSFDFYASFRSNPYGLDGLEAHASRLFVTTEDGSAGVKGMLPAVFDPALYDLVYACGPTPMLRYLQGVCLSGAEGHAFGPVVFLSLEQHMACGAGACLGCTVRTVRGNRRCCVDGPVFNAAEVIL